MSMDIPIWSAAPPALPAGLPKAAEWTAFGSSYEFDGGGWLVSVQSGPATPDVNPPFQFQTWIALEPIGADNEAYLFLEQVTRSLARELNGVWIHPGDGKPYRHNVGQF